MIQWNSIIIRALLYYTYFAFSLSIFEYIDILNLSKKEARVLILLCEQYYLIQPKYNRLKIAGSSLDYKHTEEFIIKFSEENYYLFGKTYFPSTIIKLRRKNNHMFGRKNNLYLIYEKSSSVKTYTLSRIAQNYYFCIFIRWYIYK